VDPVPDPVSERHLADRGTYLAEVRRAGDRVLDVLRSEPLDTPVPSCTGWLLADLGRHLGEIHRWVVFTIIERRRPSDDEREPAPDDDGEVAGWVEVGLARMLDLLASVPPDAPVWHPFVGPQVAGIWPRRQCHELTIHRWDAEQAVGRVPTIEPWVAADGIDEYFRRIVPRVDTRDGKAPPEGSMLVDATDVGRRWVVDGLGVRELDGAEAPPPVDGTLAGAASDVLLALWRRAPFDPGPSAVAAEWLRYGGN
jgi:uncharacterized protein (TIGR03083 family)